MLKNTVAALNKTKQLTTMRKAKPKKRLILPDPVYGDQKVSKFVNHLMYDGKKNKKSGLLIINLPSAKSTYHTLCSAEEKVSILLHQD